MLLYWVSLQVVNVILQILNHQHRREDGLCVFDCCTACCCMHTLFMYWKQGVICSIFKIGIVCISLKMLWSNTSGDINFADHLCLLCFLIALNQRKRQQESLLRTWGACIGLTMVLITRLTLIPGHCWLSKYSSYFLVCNWNLKHKITITSMSIIDHVNIDAHICSECRLQCC